MFLKELFKGISKYKKANQVIMDYGLWRYMILPGIMSVAYICLLIFVGKMFLTDFSAYVNDHWIPSFMKGDTMIILTTFLLWVFLLVVSYMSYKYVVLIFFAPFLSYLSEKTEIYLYKESFPDFNFKQLIKDIIRGLRINIRNMMLTIILTLLAWSLVFIPLVGAVLSTILIILIQSYYDGFGLIDYTLERKQYSVRESIRFCRSNRGSVMGVGMGFMLMLMIPILGWFAAPAYGTVAATLAALEKINSSLPVNKK